MAERVVPYSCYSCIHLQKENPLISGNMAMYQCTSQKRRGRCVGWVQKDKPYIGLRNQGGSCCNKLYPGDVFDVISWFSNKRKRYLYCGKKGNVRILITLPDYTYTPVPNDFLRGATGKIRRNVRMLYQTEGQKERHRKIAKEIMRKPYE